MKAFHYSLQRLLDAKIAIEDARRARVATAIRDLDRENQRLVELVAESERAAHVGLGVQECNAHTMELRSRYVAYVRQLAAKCAHNVVACEQALAQFRSEMARATMERETLERLRDREHKTWQLDVQRTEQKEMDDSALQQHSRKRRAAAISKENLAA